MLVFSNCSSLAFTADRKFKKTFLIPIKNLRKSYETIAAKLARDTSCQTTFILCAYLTSKP